MTTLTQFEKYKLTSNKSDFSVAPPLNKASVNINNKANKTRNTYLIE